MQFLRLKARSWETSQTETGTLIASPDINGSAVIETKLEKMNISGDETGSANESTDSSDTIIQRKVVCPTYSSGVDRWEELILSDIYLRILAFFETLI